MGLREDVGPAIRAIYRALFLVSGAIMLATIAVTLGLELAISAFPDSIPFIRIAMLLVVMALTFPLLVALYAPLSERQDGVVPTLRESWRAVRTQFRSLLVANGVALAVAIATGLLAVLSWYVLATGLRLSMYVLWGSRFSSSMQILYELAVAFTIGFGAGLFVTRFADLFVAFEDANPRRAWRSSAEFVRGHPVSFLGYVALTLGLSGMATVFLGFVNEMEGSVPGVTAIVVIGSVSALLWAAIHVGYFQGTVAASVTVQGAVWLLPWRRIGVGLAILSIVVAGAAVVRVADVGAGPEPIEPLPDDPGAAYAVGIENTADANHRLALTSRNRSATESFGLRMRTGLDYDDRQLYVYFYDENGTSQAGGFLAEGTYSARFGDGMATNGSLAATHSTGEWNVEHLPVFVIATEGTYTDLPATDVTPAVSAENDSKLVYRIDDPETLADAQRGETILLGMQGGFANDSTLRIIVDRKRAIVEEVQATYRSKETGQAYDYRWQFSDVGTADLERPDAIGQRHPIAWMWDAIVY